MSPQQRFKRDRPCPVCGGHADAPQGERHRCYGYLSDDGRYADCTRVEHAGRLEQDGNADTVAHYLEGHRRCGVPHVERATARPLPGGSRDASSAWSYRDRRLGQPSGSWRAYVAGRDRAGWRQGDPPPGPQDGRWRLEGVTDLHLSATCRNYGSVPGWSESKAKPRAKGA